MKKSLYAVVVALAVAACAQSNHNVRIRSVTTPMADQIKGE